MRDSEWKQKKKIIEIEIFLLICILAVLFVWKSALSRELTAYIQCTEQYDMDGSAGESYIMEINNMDDWLEFVQNVNNGRSYRGYKIELHTDLDFTDQISFAPIGSYEFGRPFEGDFYGNGHLLKNLKINSSENYVGVFGYTQGAVIKELNIQDSQIHSSSATGTGGIAGYASGSILGCSFSGTIEALEGSAGGITGNNWGNIDDCIVYGAIKGSDVNGSYTHQEKTASFGAGGVCGDNSGTVSRCINYGEVSIDSDFYDAGGIVGQNQGLIESCVNFADMNGGGIADNNRKYSTIRGCFNFGDTYAGIAVGSYQDSVIEYCVNLGHTSGRYAADIVSFWGQDNERNYRGRISQCLYTNTSGNGVARRKYFGDSSLISNFRIHSLPDEKRKQLTAYLKESAYEEAYDFVAESEEQIRNIIFCGCMVGIILIIVIGDSIFWGRKDYKKYRNYVLARKLVEKGELRNGINLYGSIADYKDSADRGKSCFREYLKKCISSGEFEIGRIGEEPIVWKCIQKTETEYRLLSKFALTVECIHAEPGDVSWRNSSLHEKLNSIYEQEWFSPIEMGFLSEEMDILTTEEAKYSLENNKQRQCKSISGLGEILTSSGHVYWWIRNVDETENSRTPFVTGEGLISEKGTWNTAGNIGVRPVITIKVENENSF